MEFFLFVPVLIFSIVVHEVAHAWQARREGDPTAEQLGRITLNPIPHLDPMGSVIVPLVLHFANAGFMFGWAKPVPVNPSNYRDRTWGDVRVSLAGIVSNMILFGLFTLFAALVVKLVMGQGGSVGDVGSWLTQMAFVGIRINLVLAFFNLLPIPPLDGSHVVYHVLPVRWRFAYETAGRYGLLVLMAIFFFAPGLLSAVLLKPVALFEGAADAFIRLWI